MARVGRKSEPTDLAGAIPVSGRSATLVHEGRQWLLEVDRSPATRTRLPGSVPALGNGIVIINYLNALAPARASLTQVATDLGISRSHCYSLLKTLVASNWLDFEATSKTYTLSAGILASISSVLNSESSIVIREELEALVAEVRFPCILAKPMPDDTFVVIDKFNPQRHAMEVSFPIGHRFPRDARALVRAYLAWQPKERMNDWLSRWTPTRYTDASVVDRDAFVVEMLATRERGYARSKGEVTDGLMAIALPLFDRAGRVAYIFHCLSLVSYLESHETEVAAAMVRTAAIIHRRLLANPSASHLR